MDLPMKGPDRSVTTRVDITVGGGFGGKRSQQSSFNSLENVDILTKTHSSALDKPMKKRSLKRVD